MNDDALKLSLQLCFPLYACSRQIIKLYTPVLEPLGLTYTQYITMLALWEKSDETVKALGERLFLDSGTLTPLLKKLEEQGLLKRERSQTDERNVVVHLTEQGLLLKDKALEVPDKVASCINLSQKDAIELHRILHLVLSDDGLKACDKL